MDGVIDRRRSCRVPRVVLRPIRPPEEAHEGRTEGEEREVKAKVPNVVTLVNDAGDPAAAERLGESPRGGKKKIEEKSFVESFVSSQLSHES